MCGIFGYIGKADVPLKAASDIIVHRGPDAEGYLGYSIPNGQVEDELHNIMSLRGMKVLFGFRRLSIIDLSHSADQPFSLSERKLHIIFNGEIYNYRELRGELKQQGYSFRTNSDTEVLLSAYAHWGKDCVTHFNGMWSFAILDEEKKQLFCSRDRFGVKPFYYHHSKEGFYFASEIKQFFVAGVKKEVNENVMRDFLGKSLVDHTTETFFKDIFQLKAGHSLIISLQGNENDIVIQNLQYWQLQSDDSIEKITYEDAQIEFKRLLSDSIRLRFRSDVPVGSCLSGGLDSSSIVSIAATLFDEKINSFTSRFDSKKFDESYYANLVVTKYSNIQPHYCSLNETILQNEIDQLIFHQDEPFGTFSVMAQWEVMKLAKKNNVTVLLDGQGGDEILGGYRKFYAFFLKEYLQKMQVAGFLKNSYYLLKNKDFNFFQKEGIYRYLGLNNKVEYLSERGKKLNPLSDIGISSVRTMNEKCRQDVEKFSYPALLRYEDRNSMAHSVEARVPFMDYRLVTFVYSLPASYKIRKGYTKALLRDSLKDVLPDEIRLRISKLGFATPQPDWMGKKLNTYFSNYFKQMKNPYLDNSAILKDFMKYPASQFHSWDFSRFFIFDKWFQQYFG